MADYGFDRLLYVYTRFRTERSIGDLQDALFLTNHPPDYARMMLERGLIRHAPMMDWDRRRGRRAAPGGVDPTSRPTTRPRGWQRS